MVQAGHAGDTSDLRTQTVALPRQVAMYLMRQLTGGHG
jgi:chromosomal replication initiation ATPase DnaA